MSCGGADDIIIVMANLRAEYVANDSNEPIDHESGQDPSELVRHQLRVQTDGSHSGILREMGASIMFSSRVRRIAAAVGLATASVAASVALSGSAQAAAAPVTVFSTPLGEVLEDSFGTATTGFRNNTSDERWRILFTDEVLPGGFNVFRLQNVASGRCLAASPPGPGQAVKVESCGTSARFKWNFALTGTKFVGIINRSSGLAVTDFGKLSQQTFTGSNSQKFLNEGT